MVMAVKNDDSQDKGTREASSCYQLSGVTRTSYLLTFTEGQHKEQERSQANHTFLTEPRNKSPVRTTAAYGGRNRIELPGKG